MKVKNQATAVSLKTMGIKARLANAIRRNLYNKPLADFSDKEKVEFFDEIHKLNHAMHWELNDYKAKRKERAEVIRQRELRKKKVA